MKHLPKFGLESTTGAHPRAIKGRPSWELCVLNADTYDTYATFYYTEFELGLRAFAYGVSEFTKLNFVEASKVIDSTNAMAYFEIVVTTFDVKDATMDTRFVLTQLSGL